MCFDICYTCEHSGSWAASCFTRDSARFNAKAVEVHRFNEVVGPPRLGEGSGNDHVGTKSKRLIRVIMNMRF